MIDNDIPPENYTISNNTQRVLNGMNLTCRYYTDVNSYKYQLQEVLFHKDVLPNELLEKITSILINLQVAASSLQHIRVRITINNVSVATSYIASCITVLCTSIDDCFQQAVPRISIGRIQAHLCSEQQKQ